MEAHRERKKAERRAAKFAKADANGDGTISVDEFQAGKIEKHFERLDTDSDGLITEAEREAAKATRGGRRGKRGEQRGGGEHHGPRGS